MGLRGLGFRSGMCPYILLLGGSGDLVIVAL